MGYGKRRKISTISKKISTSCSELPPSTSRQSDLARSLPNDEQGSSGLGDTEAKKGVRRRSIYAIEDDSNQEVNDRPVPPDGGYGWVIVIAVLLIQAMSMGFLTSLGIFYIEWREYFNASAAQTSLVIALSSVVIGLISPLAVGIAGLFGPRPLVMIGSVIVFAGLLVSSFTESVMELTFTFGVLTAFGYGMICSPAVLIIADYFDENYALANGIAFAGVSIGQLIFPPISVEFIYWFGGWKGALFILSALLLNLAVCGALLRPLKTVQKNIKQTSTLEAVVVPATYQNEGFVNDLSNGNFKNPSASCDNHSDTEIPSLKTKNELPLLEMTVFDEWAVPYVVPHQQSSDSKRNRSIDKYKSKFTAIIKKTIQFLAKCYGIPGVFLSPLFVIMIPAIICVAIGWYANVTHTAARAMAAGVSEEDASFLLSLMGIGSLIGRTGHGWLLDRNFMTCETCLTVSLGMCSAATFLITVTSIFSVLAILATIQGMTAGIVNTLFVVIIKTFAKPGYEDTAVGMLYLFWGIGDLAGGVLAGFIYDSTGNYNISFYFAGTSLAVATVLVYATCILKDRIVAGLYAKLALRQIQTRPRGDSCDRLEETNNTDDTGYDNDAFNMGSEEELKNKGRAASSESGLNTVNVHPMFQIEIHSSKESACDLSDTNVRNCEGRQFYK